jgi:hypothetical protein
VEAERAGEPTFVQYSTVLLWFGTVSLLGIGGLLLLAVPVVGACFAACGVLCLAGLRRARHIGDRALVIDDVGLTYTTLARRVRYHVPWSEIIAVREGDRGVGLRLRAPQSRFRVPPREPRRERDHGSLFLPDLLNISLKELVGLIQAHLLDADDGTEA